MRNPYQEMLDSLISQITTSTVPRDRVTKIKSLIGIIRMSLQLM